MFYSLCTFQWSPNNFLLNTKTQNIIELTILPTDCFVLVSILIFWWSSLFHFRILCSYSYLEISGECNMMREVYRGRFQPEKGHQECVKRRAALSLSMSGACKVINFYIIVYFITIIIISPCHPLHNLIFFLIPFRYIYYLNLITFHYTEISTNSFFC